MKIFFALWNFYRGRSSSGMQLQLFAIPRRSPVRGLGDSSCPLGGLASDDLVVQMSTQSHAAVAHARSGCSALPSGLDICDAKRSQSRFNSKASCGFVFDSMWPNSVWSVQPSTSRSRFAKPTHVGM